MIENYIGKCELCGSRNVCKPCAGPQDDGDLSIFDRKPEGKTSEDIKNKKVKTKPWWMRGW